MSSPARTCARWIGLAGALLVLAACGYKPLYERTDSGAVGDDLAMVQVDVIRDRTGQQLHNVLRDRINPTGRPASPRYALEVELTESREALAIRKDETATRYNLNQSAQFALRDLETSRVVLSGTSEAATSYNVLTNDFSNISAENDARRRGVREIGENLRTRLAVFFNARRAKAGG